MYYTEFETELCPMVIVGDETGIRNLHLDVSDGSRRNFDISSEWTESSDFFVETIQQIKEYLMGERKSFNVVLNPRGTAFQKQVWKELCNIPVGNTASYKEIAEQISKPKAYRAVGTANGKNPIPIIIPCHRVTKANKELGDYAFGAGVKKRLIELEIDGAKG